MCAITTQQMQRADRLTVQRYGIPVLLLMENAGRCVAEAARDLAKRTDCRRFLIFCGSGNNGGDGVAAARYLHHWGYNVQVLWLRNPRQWVGDLGQHYRMAKALGVRFTPFGRAKRSNLVLRLARPNACIVDALLGTGTRGEIREAYRQAIEVINRSRRPVVAVDIPSGLDADTGRSLGATVRARITVTMAAPKIGMLNPDARPYVGRLRIADIGIPKNLLKP